MAITSVGTPANAHGAAGSVTGTWPSGSSQTAGNLLVAVVTAGASTSAAAISTPSGWTKQLEEGNAATANTRCAVYTKTAAGGDTAPAFTSTETGTAGGMDCMLFELAGANTTTPVDVSGVFGSGTSSTTLSNAVFTVTTSANVTAAGEYAIAVFSQERTAASLTFTDSGTGWTKLLNGNGNSARNQTAILVQANPASGATLNDHGQFSTDTSAFGAAIVIVFAAAPPPPPSGQLPGALVVTRRLIRSVWAGLARSITAAPVPGSEPGGTVVPRKAAQRPRAVTAHVYGKPAATVLGPAGSQPGGLVRRRRPARAVFAGLAVAPVVAHAVTGGMVAHRPPVQHARAVAAHVTGAPAATAAGPRGNAPGGLVAQRSAARRPRAVTAHAYGTAGPVTLGPAGSLPGGLVINRRLARSVWAGLSSRAQNAAPVPPPAGSKPGGFVSRRRKAGYLAGAISGTPVPFPAGQAPGGLVAQRPAKKRPRAVAAHIAGKPGAAVLGPAGSRPGGIVRRRSPARAVTAHVAGRAFPNGSRPGGTGVYRRRPARAVIAGLAVAPATAHPVTGGAAARRAPAQRPRAVAAHITGSAPPPGVVAGSPPGGLVVRRQPGGGLWGGLASSRVAPAVLGPAGSKPGGQVARRAAARAVTAHAYGAPSAIVPSGVAGSAPGGLVVRRQTGGGLWGGLASSRVAPPPPPNGSKPGGQVARRAPARAVTAHVAGPQPRPPLIAVRPQISRRQPSWWLWRGIAATGIRAIGAAGSAPGGAVAQRPASPRARAVTAHAAGIARPSGHQPGGAVMRRRPARAVTAGTVARTVNATPAAPVNGSHQPRAAVPVPRRYPARAFWAGSTARDLGRFPPPPGSQPGGTVKRRAPARAVTARILGAARVAAAQTGSLIRRRAPARAVIAGTTVRTVNAPPVPGTVQARATVPVPRRYPARALWAGVIVRTVNAPPAFAGPGIVAAADRAVNTVAAADSQVMTVIAADWPAGTVLAADYEP